MKDIGALLDWIATSRASMPRAWWCARRQPRRLHEPGGGGDPERIAGAIDVVGISNFVTFLRNTESYRRDLRRVEYGDERDEAMRSLPRTHLTDQPRGAHRQAAVRGAGAQRSARAPTEAEQIVEKVVTAQGTPVWYLRAENEGHGFQRKENADFQFWATTLFLRQTLLR